MTPPADQLPAIIEPGALTPMPDTHLVPALIAASGEQAGWRYVEFFTANIRQGGSNRFVGWQNVSIGRSCESMPNNWSLTASAEFLQGAPMSAHRYAETTQPSGQHANRDRPI
jgi:hypothetical protein